MTTPVTATAPSPAEDSIKIAFAADIHITAVPRLAPGPHNAFERAGRTSAQDFAGPAIGMQAWQRFGELEEQGYTPVLLGDYVYTAGHEQEWLLFLATRHNHLLSKLLGANCETWGDDQWATFYSRSRELLNLPELKLAIQAAEQEDGREFPISAAGNHEVAEEYGTWFDTKRPHFGQPAMSIPGLFKWLVPGVWNFETWTNHYLSLRYSAEALTEAPQTIAFGTRLTINENTLADLYQTYWKEMPNKNYLCRVMVQTPLLESGQFPLVIEAKWVGTVNGEPSYLIVLNSSDVSGSVPYNASKGVMSALQKDLVQIFIDQKKRESANPLFPAAMHISIVEQKKRSVNNAGWNDLFSQSNVLPVTFSANEHEERIVDAAAEGFVKRAGGFYSVMEAAVIDSPNKFMTVEISWDDAKQEVVIVQKFQSIIPDKMKFTESVQQAVREFEVELSHQHDMTHSRFKKGLFPAGLNIGLRKEAVAEDTINSGLESLKEDLRFTKKYLEFLEQDHGSVAPITRLVQHYYDNLERHLESSECDVNEAALDAQAIQFLMTQEPPAPDGISEANQFLVLLAKTAAENEGQPGTKYGETPPVIPQTNMFWWNKVTDVVTRQ